jgi:hypothetical protein
MDDNPSLPSTPVDHFLDAYTPAAADAGASQALLVQTTRVLRRRRRLKRFGLIALLAACYAAGLGTMRLAQRTPERPTSPPLAQPTPAPTEQESARADTAVAATLPLEDDPDVPAVVLERLAEAGGARQARLYLAAGDRYLNAHGEVQAALRCYRRALQLGTEQERAVSAEDNWLLIALKNAQRKGIGHERNGS